MWQRTRLMVEFGTLRAVTVTRVGADFQVVERSVDMRASPEQPQDVAVEEPDDGAVEEPELTHLALRGVPLDPHLHNRRVRLRLLIAVVAAIMLGGAAFLAQGRTLGLEPVTVARTGWTVIACALLLLFFGLFRFLPHPVEPPPRGERLDERLAKRLEITAATDRRLYVAGTIAISVVLIAAFGTIAVGALIIILENRNSAGITISAVGVVAGALSMFYRTTLQRHHKLLLDRYVQQPPKPKSKGSERKQRVSKG